jgi:hypothetical protein
MNFYATHYQSGEEIRLGDRILWAGRSGTVLFVLGLPGVPADWASPEDWLGKPNTEGFMLDVDGAGLVFEEASDEDLEFLGRRA